MSRMIDDEETLKDNGLIEIDGCNVEECKYFSEIQHIMSGNELIIDVPDACLEHAITNPCENYKDCYFKQLQRLKAELEQYKKSAVRVNELKASDKIEFKQHYKTENERLQAENEQLHITIEKLKGDLYIAEDSLRDYQEHYNKLQAELDKYRQVD